MRQLKITKSITNRESQSLEKYLQENRKLKIERASLASPSRIEKVAKNKLGMINPKNNQMVILKW